ncbi:Saccharopine dehydrogenase [Desmophyllum pertusum]|uniref:Saccharopine dehydrogenase n=1 Tax=Desmophyllum pertusum TaxID=174260 RepID=A0A9W9Y7U6_9CNID|nr:Saccharopine dehydrogenase [Desmophyllum pertusum]
MRFQFTVTMAGGGWTMIFKAVSGVDQGAFDAYNSGVTYDESNMAALDVTKSDRDYKNRIVLNWNNFDKSKARVVLYTGGNQVKELKFDAVGSDKLNWFTSEKLRGDSSWFADIQFGPRNYFSIQGHGGANRDFFINKKYAGCEEDFGWLVITGTACDWEKASASKHHTVQQTGCFSQLAQWRSRSRRYAGCLVALRNDQNHSRPVQVARVKRQ